MSNEYFNHDDPAQPGTKVASAQFNNTMQAVEAGFDLLPTSEQFLLDNVRYGVATLVATNVFNLSLPALSDIFGYVEGMGILVKFPNDNTGACQINVNGMGLKEMRSPFGQTLQGGDIITGVIYDLRYDGTYFQVLNAVESSLTTLTELVSQARDGANVASTAANDATIYAGQTLTIRNNSQTKLDQLTQIVDDLQTLPLATSTSLGVVYVTDDYTTVPTEDATALTARGANMLYQVLDGKSPTIHTHPWSEIIGVPEASTTVMGITQLYDGVNSQSITLAATANSVRIVNDGLANKAPTIHSHTWAQINNVPLATVDQVGIARLSNSLTLNSASVAASSAAAYALYQMLQNRAPAEHTHPWSQITNVPVASATVEGVIRVINNAVSTDATAALSAAQGKVLLDNLNGKAALNHTHPWSDITGSTIATSNAYGVVLLSESVNTTGTGYALSVAGARTYLQQQQEAIAKLLKPGDFGSTNVNGIIIGCRVGVGQFMNIGTEYTDIHLSDFAGRDLGLLPGTWRAGGTTALNATGGARATVLWRTA